MKKILSVMLAIMMLFGALSVSASAVEAQDLWGKTPGQVTLTKGTHAILSFDYYGGKSYSNMICYDAGTGKFIEAEASGIYLMLPGAYNSQRFTTVDTYGDAVRMPIAVKDGEMLLYWYCVETGQQLAPDSAWFVPEYEKSAQGVFHFTARYAPAEPEEDTMKTVLGVLTKVFGTILGILFLDGSSSAGIALVEKLLGGLL